MLRDAAEVNLIRHIVFFTAKSPENVAKVREGLKPLATIPGSTVFEVLENKRIDPIGNEIDIVVYAEFPDEHALAAFKAHPIYSATTAQVRPLRELRFSADVHAAV